LEEILMAEVIFHEPHRPPCGKHIKDRAALNEGRFNGWFWEVVIHAEVLSRFIKKKGDPERTAIADYIN
jgi:hypothetical protein